MIQLSDEHRQQMAQGSVTAMFQESQAFSGFSVDDVEKARAFYADTLGLGVTVLDESMGLLQLDLSGGGRVLAYGKGEAHEPASFTILNFPVADVEAAVDALAAKGVEFERYDGFDQDDKGIARGPGADDRLVPRPGRQHLVGARGPVTKTARRKPEEDCRWCEA